MCHGCWTDAGSPVQTPAGVERFIELARRLYDDLDCPTGGPLHIVLDDWNLEAEHLRWCVDQLDQRPGRESPEVEQACREIVALMLAWSESERYAAMGHWEGFAEPSLAV